ncbi:unnamed protein product, partial [Vitis vinifera]
MIQRKKLYGSHFSKSLFQSGFSVFLYISTFPSQTWSLVPREASLKPLMVVPASGSSPGVVDPRLIWPKVVACSLPEVEMVVGSISKKPQISAPAAKAQVVGWPPIRYFRKNSMASNLPKNNEGAEGKLGSRCLYAKVNMDGAPYLRKVDLKLYCTYMELSSALEKMFSCFTIGQCVLIMFDFYIWYIKLNDKV